MIMRGALVDPVMASAPSGLWRDALRRLRRNRLAMIGVACMTLFFAAAILAPVYYALLGDVLWWNFNGAILALLCVMGVLLVWRHRDNVNRLIAGTESKLGAKKN